MRHRHIRQMSALKFLLMVFLALTVTASFPTAARANDGDELSEQQLMSLIKTFDGQHVVEKVENTGVAFPVDEGTMKRLREAGASGAVLRAVKQAAQRRVRDVGRFGAFAPDASTAVLNRVKLDDLSSNDVRSRLTEEQLRRIRRLRERRRSLFGEAFPFAEADSDDEESEPSADTDAPAGEPGERPLTFNVLEDNTLEICYSDGRVDHFEPDGSYTTIYPDGTASQKMFQEIAEATPPPPSDENTRNWLNGVAQEQVTLIQWVTGWNEAEMDQLLEHEQNLSSIYEKIKYRQRCVRVVVEALAESQTGAGTTP